MIYSKKCFSLLVFLGLMMNASTQNFDLFNFEKNTSDYSQLTGIFFNNEALINDNVLNGPLQISPDATGKLIVATMNENCSTSSAKMGTPIGFKIAIKDYRSGSVWMY